MSRFLHLASITARYLGYVNKSLSVLSMLVVASLVVIVSLQVIMRYFFKEPIDWVFELSEYGMILIVFLPLAFAEQLGQHIRVDAITSRLSPKKLKKLNVITISLSLFYIGIFAWSATRYARLAYDMGWNSGPYKLGLDKWPVLASMAIGLVLLCLNIMFSLIRQIAEIVKKERDNTPNEGTDTLQ